MEFHISKDAASVHVEFDAVDVKVPPEPFEIEDECRKLNIKVPVLIEEYEKLKTGGMLQVGKRFLIAKGTLPVLHVPELYFLEQPAVEAEGQITELRKLARDGSLHHSLLKKRFPRLEVLKADKTIGKIQAEIPGSDGLDVFGKILTLPYEKIHQPDLDLETIQCDYVTGLLKTLVPGVLIKTAKSIFIIPVDTGSKFEVVRDRENMSASIRAWPDISGKAEISQDQIYEILGKEGVVFGIIEENFIKIEKEAETAESLPAIVEISRGIKPTAGQPEKYELTAPSLHKPERIKEFEKLVKAGKNHHSQIKKALPELLFIQANTVIGKVRKESQGAFGKDILGNELPPPELEVQTPVLDPEAIQCEYEKEYLIAKLTGVLLKGKDLVTIVPVNAGHHLEIRENEDHTRADLIIYPDIHGEAGISEAEVRELLASRKINTGIHMEIVGGLDRQVKHAESFPLTVCIAEGSPAVNGKDAYIEYLVDVEESLKPTIREDGSADFKDVKIMEVVEAGQELARMVPGEKGVPGMNLLGVILPARDGATVSLPGGKNTSVMGPAGDILVSDIKGIVKRESQLLHVSQGFQIAGNVDFSTGNIRYDEDIIVNGDVKGGFFIRSRGAVEIKGVVENACITTHGSVLLHSGFVGDSTGVIRAWGNVGIKFINGQKVFAGGEIVIQKECIHAALYSRKSIFLCGAKNSFAGGKIMAREIVEVEVLGSPSYPKGLMILGWDYRAYRILETIHKRLMGMGNRINQLREGLEKFRAIEAKLGKLTAELEATKSKISAGLERMLKVLEKLETRKKRIEERWIFNKDARLIIKRKAYPGTVVQIGYEKYLINKELGRGTILLKNGNVEFVGG